MTSIKPKRIHIIGSVGSGKTTLARQLSKSLQIPFYELDNIVWTRSKQGDIRNRPDVRDQKLAAIVQGNEWIIEGVHHTWVQDSFKKADLIIFLDTSFSKRKYRIIKRFILQKLKMEKSNYKPSIKIFIKMFEWNRHFEHISKHEILHILEVYQEKLKIIKEPIELLTYIDMTR
ncbi:AAA family ATPase [Bacillus oleivorans]|uniref:AAA family ATPase n=1 Tax=Bacillus oleivorans TaxID=1448271 RepID=UPI000BE24229|nr:AAA family ATPase [Bacillus oleivorans]